jgi:DNA-3-methyladenine glycosylase II
VTRRSARAAGDAARATRPGRVVWKAAYERLLEDPHFRPLVQRVGPVRLQTAITDPFAFLVRSITFQQLAGKAAATIHGRLVEALGGHVSPAAIHAVSDDALRAAGLSRGKLASIRDLALRVSEDDVPLEQLKEMSDEEVVQHLVRVRGIGRWTAEMLLLFHLRRRDVWPVADLGVRAGMGRILGWPEPPNARELELMGIGYRPWRSATAWYCWRAVEQLTRD